MSKSQALSFFVSRGWTVPQAAGIVANLVAESGLNPSAVGDGGAAYGIAQWHPDRQAGFERLFGHPIQGSSVEDQLVWVDAELRTTERSAGLALQACVTASQAGACVSEKYERPADRAGEAAKRAKLAESIAQDYSQPDTQPAAPIEERSTPLQPENRMGALVFLPQILSMIPQLVGAFSKGGKAEGNQKLAQTVVDVFTAAVPGAVNAQQAIEMAAADPAARAAATTAVLTQPDLAALLPVFDRINTYEQGSWAAEETSRNAAATRALAQQDSGPLWTNPTFLLATFVMGLVAFVVGVVLLKGGFSTDMQAFVIGAVVGSALTAVLGFYFGSSRNSSAKDATIAQLANNK